MKLKGSLTQLISGNVIAQLVTLSFTPLLTRLYSPHDFGVVSSLLAVVSLCIVAVHGRYHMAIPLPKSENTASALLYLSILLVTILTTPVVFVIFVFSIGFSSSYAIEIFIAAIVLVAGSSLIEIFSYWRSRYRFFSYSAKLSAARSTLTSICQLLAVPVGALGLVTGAVIGTTLAATLSYFHFSKHKNRLIAPLTLTRWKRVTSAYHAYPIYGVPQGFIATFSWNALPLLLSRYSNLEFVGFYWISYRILVSPLALFNGAYRQATIPRFARLTKEDSANLIKLHIRWMLALAILPILSTFIWGPTIFKIALGAQWQEAGTVASWLCIAILTDFLKIPVLCLLQSTNQHRTVLVWETSIMIFRYTVTTISLVTSSPITAVAAFSLTGFFGWMIFIATNVKTLSWTKGSSSND